MFICAIFMHYKGLFVLAGIFLAVAIIVPAVLLLGSQSGLQRLIITENPSGMATGGNATAPASAELEQANFQNIVIIAVVEIIFIPAFLITLYFGINHMHPSHKRV
jgi:hypothetical protein